MTPPIRVYVALPQENVDVWRPVLAEPLGGNTYRILPQEYDRDVEAWAFEPGDSVICEWCDLGSGQVLVAKRRAIEG